MDRKESQPVKSAMGYFKETVTPVGISLMELEILRGYIQLLHEEYALAAKGDKDAQVPDFRDYKLNYCLTTFEERASGAELPRLP